MPLATGSESQLILSALSLATGATFDLADNTMILNYGGGTDPITSIAGDIKSGYNGGGWNGTGIISSTAQTPTNGLLYGLGYADGKDNVVTGLTSGQIEVKYTLLGDANLDSLVNGSDFNVLAANFNQSITGWDQGDFNYDGLVNAADFNELAANFNQGVSLPAVAASAAVPAFATVTTTTAPKPKPVITSKVAIRETSNRKPKVSAAAYAAGVVTIPSAASASTPQNVNDKDAKFLADR
jgi:hypothetical protein